MYISTLWRYSHTQCESWPSGYSFLISVTAKYAGRRQAFLSKMYSTTWKMGRNDYLKITVCVKTNKKLDLNYRIQENGNDLYLPGGQQLLEYSWADSNGDCLNFIQNTFQQIAYTLRKI